MTDYARIESAIRWAHNSALSDSMTQGYLFDAVSPTKYLHLELSAATTGTTLELGTFTTIIALIVANHDATNFVEAKWRYTKSTKTFGANKLGFTNAAPCTVTDDDSTFLTALRARAGDFAVISGATEAANNGTFLVQAAVAGTLTMIESVAFTLDADDAGTPTITMVTEIEQRIPVSQHALMLYVRPDNDLVLTANTAACECDVYVIGT